MRVVEAPSLSGLPFSVGPGEGPGNLTLQKRAGPREPLRRSLWIDRRAGLVGRACSATWWAALTLRLPQLTWIWGVPDPTHPHLVFVTTGAF